ncbi:hypothetical protein [Polaromonas sp. AER18D-145]|nr:hypothetical protein [Polaromonas sp. AER18D-145]
MLILEFSGVKRKGWVLDGNLDGHGHAAPSDERQKNKGFDE